METLVFGARAMRGDQSIVALAGRRIDAIDAPIERFPLGNVDCVADQLRQAFTELAASTLVCSAANGADLIALDVARELGVRCRIVLPCLVDEFRRESVGDRPDARWIPLFDDLIASAVSAGELVVVERDRQGASDTLSGLHASRLAVNARIIEEAMRLAGSGVVIGVAVWDGCSRGDDDITAAFVDSVEALRMPVRHVSTLANAPTLSPSPP